MQQAEFYQQEVSSMAPEDDDEDFQADLARAIAASLEPDGAGAPEDGPDTGRASGGWRALLAASKVATVPLAPAPGAHRAAPSSPINLAEDDDGAGGGAGRYGAGEDEYERALQAAVAASIRSAEEEADRRRRGLAGGPPVAGPGPQQWNAAPQGQHHRYHQQQQQQQPIGGVFPSVPQGPTGAVCCPAGLVLKPLGPGRTSGAGHQGPEGGRGSGVLTAAAPVPVPLPGGHPLAPLHHHHHHQYAGLASSQRCSSGSGVEAAGFSNLPPLLPAQPPAAATALGAGSAHLGATSPAAAASGGGAQQQQQQQQHALSSSPAKHAREPSLAGTAESAQPLVKRSRPASDNGAAPFPASASAALSPSTSESSGGPGMGPGPEEGATRPSGASRALSLPPPGSSGCEEGSGWGLMTNLAVSTPPERPASAASGCTTATATGLSAGTTAAAVAAALAVSEGVDRALRVGSGGAWGGSGREGETDGAEPLERTGTAPPAGRCGSWPPTAGPASFPSSWDVEAEGRELPSVATGDHPAAPSHVLSLGGLPGGGQQWAHHNHQHHHLRRCGSAGGEPRGVAPALDLSRPGGQLVLQSGLEPGSGGRHQQRLLVDGGDGGESGPGRLEALAGSRCTTGAVQCSVGAEGQTHGQRSASAGPEPMPVDGQTFSGPFPAPPPPPPPPSPPQSSPSGWSAGVGPAAATAALALHIAGLPPAPARPPALPLPGPPPQPQPSWVYSGADRRMLLHQRVWWWLGPGQVQLGRICAIDRRSEPLLFTVRLDGDGFGGTGTGGGGGDDTVIATADCLLPYLSHGDPVMCRLVPPPPPPTEEEGPQHPEAVQSAGTAGCDGGGGVTVPMGGCGCEASAAPVSCSWMCGSFQHCVFDGPLPLAHVILGGAAGDGMPYTLPYEYVVPVRDAAEGSGCGAASTASYGSGWGQQHPGGGVALGGGTNYNSNTCMDIVPVVQLD